MSYKIKNPKIPTNKDEFEAILSENRGLSADWFFPVPAENIPLEAVGLNENTVKHAIDILRQHRHDNVVIAGDYDADGCCSSFILSNFLSKLRIKNKVFIPDRKVEGYGLSLETAQKIVDAGAQLVITVDNGITASEPIAFLRSKGIAVILTDHHKPESHLPQPDAIVHSTDMCGTAVIWFFMRELTNNNPSLLPIVLDYLPFVAIATITDVMPINRYNRSLILDGCRRLTEAKFKGLTALLQVNDINANQINTYDIGFKIGPCINAVSRMKGTVDPVMKMLEAADGIEASRYARELLEINKQRKEEQQKAVELVDSLVKQDQKIIFVKAPVDAGIMGPIANTIAEKYGRPAFIANDQGEKLKGSARGIDGVDVVKILRQTTAVGGGHTKAAGFSVLREKVPLFEQQLQKLGASLKIEDVVRFVDCQLDPQKISQDDIFATLQDMEPYGELNYRVTVMCKGIVETYQYLGKNNEHFKFTMNGLTILFFNADPEKMPQDGDSVEVYGELGINNYKGRLSLQIIASEIKII